MGIVIKSAIFKELAKATGYKANPELENERGVILGLFKLVDKLDDDAYGELDGVLSEEALTWLEEAMAGYKKEKGAPLLAFPDAATKTEAKPPKATAKAKPEAEDDESAEDEDASDNEEEEDMKKPVKAKPGKKTTAPKKKAPAPAAKKKAPPPAPAPKKKAPAPAPKKAPPPAAKKPVKIEDKEEVKAKPKFNGSSLNGEHRLKKGEYAKHARGAGSIKSIITRMLFKAPALSNAELREKVKKTVPEPVTDLLIANARSQFRGFVQVSIDTGIDPRSFKLN